MQLNTVERGNRGAARSVYSFEQHIQVQLEFTAMEAPVEISVPWNALFFLDTHSERRINADGSVTYRNPSLAGSAGGSSMH